MMRLALLEDVGRWALLVLGALVLLSSPAEAQIVANCGTNTPLVVPPSITSSIDLDCDGDQDMDIANVAPNVLVILDCNPYADTLLEIDEALCASATNMVAKLGGGAIIDGTSTLSSQGLLAEPTCGDAAGWALPPGYAGFLTDGASGAVFGWVEILILPDGRVSIQSYAFESSGGSITAGTVPVELQSFTVE